jgi:hypothetical protein
MTREPFRFSVDQGCPVLIPWAAAHPAGVEPTAVVDRGPRPARTASPCLRSAVIGACRQGAAACPPATWPAPGAPPGAPPAPGGDCDHSAVGVEAHVRLCDDQVPSDRRASWRPPGQVSDGKHDLVCLTQPLLRLVLAEEVGVDAVLAPEHAVGLRPRRPLAPDILVVWGPYHGLLVERDPGWRLALAGRRDRLEHRRCPQAGVVEAARLQPGPQPLGRPGRLGRHRHAPRHHHLGSASSLRRLRHLAPPALGHSVTFTMSVRDAFITRGG